MVFWALIRPFHGHERRRVSSRSKSHQHMQAIKWKKKKDVSDNHSFHSSGVFTVLKSAVLLWSYLRALMYNFDGI